MTLKNTIGAVCLAFFLMSRTSHGFTLDYFLDVQMDGTWTLSASTDAPGGIAAVVVNLVNVTSATSVAPRSEVALVGFIEGNIFSGGQAFAGQNPFTGFGEKIVHGVGYAPVPDSAFTSGMAGHVMVGSANSVPVPFYSGTWDTQSSIPQFNWMKPGTGAVFPNETSIFGTVPGIRFLPSVMVPTPPRPGDFDGDWDVDGADFVAWQTNFPQSSAAILHDGDADGDGDVDGADFVIWQTNFGIDGSIAWDGMDADGDGDIDSADYVVWQTNFPTLPDGSGDPVPGDLSGDGGVDGVDYVILITNFPVVSGSVVPEPTGGFLIAAAMFCFISGRFLRDQLNRSSQGLTRQNGSVDLFGVC